MTEAYLEQLFKSYQKGDAREKTYCEHLAEYLREFFPSRRKKKALCR